ncbi:hypothetical protein BZA70DRAFT_89674 [Myxozyma melibiosi]|uniref:Uncharacterized protein n=1 Tax=Myxozyma melibiosi TaxID=54550 RepID=A0ABR1EZJ1_9ASCO
MAATASFEIIVLPPLSSMATFSRSLLLAAMPSLLQPYLQRQAKLPDPSLSPPPVANLSKYIDDTFGLKSYAFPGVRLSSPAAGAELVDIAFGSSALLRPPAVCDFEFIESNVLVCGRVYICPFGTREEKKWHSIARGAAMDQILATPKLAASPTFTRFTVSMPRPATTVRKVTRFSDGNLENSIHAAAAAATSSVNPDASPDSKPRRARDSQPFTATIIQQHISESTPPDFCITRPQSTESAESKEHSLEQAPPTTWRSHNPLFYSIPCSPTPSDKPPHSSAQSKGSLESSNYLDAVLDPLPVSRLNIENSSGEGKQISKELPESPVRGLRPEYFISRPPPPPPSTPSRKRSSRANPDHNTGHKRTKSCEEPVTPTTCDQDDSGETQQTSINDYFLVSKLSGEA